LLDISEAERLALRVWCSWRFFWFCRK